ncbi:ankyrin repeat domain-containing protein [Candidatus Cardinium sp. TP]|nr:ankyrin repeat domain-containing protein [Candidatus Cardinium sp. TP]
MLLGYERTDINNAGGGDTTLVLACKLQVWEIVQILLNYTGNQTLDVTIPDPASGKHPLHLAAQEGSLEVITLLLDPKYKDKVDVNAKDKEGNTALYLAAENGHKDVVERLMPSIRY